MKREYRITAKEAGRRLDLFLTDLLKGRFSRSTVQRLVREGRVLVNSRNVAPARRLETGDAVSVDLTGVPEPDAPFRPEPRPDIPLEIIFEDRDVIVVVKPSGLLVHPARREQDTLVNALLAHAPEISGVGESPRRPGIVHRLDKEASGLLVAAKSFRAYDSLKSQFRKHRIEKEYLVLVHGRPHASSGEISLAVGRKRHSGRMTARPARSAKDRAALTRFRTVEELPGATLLAVRTETGRTHQIRTHLKALGCPVIGDALYGKDRGRRKIPATRLFLHASRLGFTHPSTDRKLHFSSALPPELQETLAALRADGGKKKRFR